MEDVLSFEPTTFEDCIQDLKQISESLSGLRDELSPLRIALENIPNFVCAITFSGFNPVNSLVSLIYKNTKTAGTLYGALTAARSNIRGVTDAIDELTQRIGTVEENFDIAEKRLAGIEDAEDAKTSIAEKILITHIIKSLLGCETTENSASAWLGRLGADADWGWGTADINAYLGRVNATADFDGGLMKKSYKYEDGEWKEEFNLAYLKGELGASGSLISLIGNTSMGDSTLGMDVKGEGHLGYAGVEGKAELKIGTDGIKAGGKAEAMVAAAKGKVKGTIKFLGIEITGKATGYAGAVGAEGEIKAEITKDGKVSVSAEAGLAALVGGNLGVDITIDPSWWSERVKSIAKLLPF